jgi:beta-N-acetylhexosaminidase
VQLACIQKLPLELQIGQKIMVAAYSSQLAQQTPVLVAQRVGGIIVMDAISQQQLQQFRDAMTVVPFIAVDQEGGTVQRYTAAGVVPGAEAMAQQFSTSQAYNTYLNDDRYLKGIGITTNFAPVLGVINGNNSVLPGRMYADTAQTVTDYARASLQAADDAGITPVVKHFPGLGTASGNTDFGSATTAPLASLQARDIKPFMALASQHPDVMVANAIVPDLTNGQPAVWSPAAISLLRSMGYQDAVVYSDSLTAKAIPGSLADAAVKAWGAGVDVALIVQTEPQTPEIASDVQAIITEAEAAVQSGALSQDVVSASVAQIFARKGIDACTMKL